MTRRPRSWPTSARARGGGGGALQSPQAHEGCAARRRGACFRESGLDTRDVEEVAFFVDPKRLLLLPVATTLATAPIRRLAGRVGTLDRNDMSAGGGRPTCPLRRSCLERPRRSCRPRSVVRLSHAPVVRPRVTTTSPDRNRPPQCSLARCIARLGNSCARSKI